MDKLIKRAVSRYRSARDAAPRSSRRDDRAHAHPLPPARAYRTVTGKWEAPLGSPRSGSA
ncbi:MAG: hypothetical protein AVDCRST_MAG69-2448 [uncultured Solirubrobacteraceae bacterium]|uniref:Uncharacterized protein n=1 Tax=uncultured Solirubrobacteraceae bacterium TaxID=1162706 RepID=A0A6J4T0Y6_9ACTN|nr:MAG: hypothetical protein AVDCRST_MAG69-2448 [uncultured Solirubrobacteraceae bacterium]